MPPLAGVSWRSRRRQRLRETDRQPRRFGWDVPPLGSVHAMHACHVETSAERPAVGQACRCSRGRSTIRHSGWPSCRLAGRGPACGAAHRRTPIKGSRHVRVRRPAPRGRSARALATRRACSSYSSAAGAPRSPSAGTKRLPSSHHGRVSLRSGVLLLTRARHAAHSHSAQCDADVRARSRTNPRARRGL